jgi:hypothetical protein
VEPPEPDSVSSASKYSPMARRAALNPKLERMVSMYSFLSRYVSHALVQGVVGFALLFAASWSAHAQRSMFESLGDPGHGFSRSWVDINGDGKDDYCLITGPQRDLLRCYTSLGDQLNATPISASLGGMSGTTFSWTDVNGDGQTDICRLLAPPSPFRFFRSRRRM